MNATQVETFTVVSGRRRGQMDWGFALSGDRFQATGVRHHKVVGASGKACKCISLQHWLAFFTPLNHTEGL